ELARLHLKVAKGKAVTGHKTPEPKDRDTAVLEIVPVSATGTGVFLAAIISGLFLGVSPATMAATLARTVRRMVPAFAAILCMLALGFVTKYSGLDTVLGLAFTRTGPLLYPLFGTLLGWVGVALTGSDTSSNVLFGNLQKITARKLGLNEILMASANTTGGVMGKMIDAQSIVVAAAATGEGGKEGDILRTIIRHSIALALLVGAIVWVYAHVFKGGRGHADRPELMGLGDGSVGAETGTQLGSITCYVPVSSPKRIIIYVRIGRRVERPTDRAQIIIFQWDTVKPGTPKRRNALVVRHY